MHVYHSLFINHNSTSINFQILCNISLLFEHVHLAYNTIANMDVIIIRISLIIMLINRYINPYRFTICRFRLTSFFSPDIYIYISLPITLSLDVSDTFLMLAIISQSSCYNLRRGTHVTVSTLIKFDFARNL
jgi:hypothetical protein